MNRDTERRDDSHISTDRETIRTWADTHGATPYRHRDTEEFRVVPGEEAGGSHEKVEWDEFFDHLDEGDHVVIYHGEEAESPFEVSKRDDAFARSEHEREELEERLMDGETVTSTVTETTVVEEVIVEEATIESELVDTEIVDQRVTDVDLLSRTCTECSLEDTGAMSADEWFDRDRYVETGGRPEATANQSGTGSAVHDVEGEYPFTAVLDVEEAWSVTREFTERYTVESRVADVDVEESDTVSDTDIDVEGLQRSIVESGIIDVDLSPKQIMTEAEVETEFHEDDEIHTHFTRTRVVEDEVVDRQRVRADVTSAETRQFERLESRDLDRDAGTDETTAGTGTDQRESITTLSNDEVGKDVVDATGEKVGMVTEIAEDGQTAYVDAHPGLAERIKAALDWGGADDDDYPVDVQQIGAVTRDEIQLKAADEMEETAPSA